MQTILAIAGGLALGIIAYKVYLLKVVFDFWSRR